MSVYPSGTTSSNTVCSKRGMNSNFGRCSSENSGRTTKLATTGLDCSVEVLDDVSVALITIAASFKYLNAYDKFLVMKTQVPNTEVILEQDSRIYFIHGVC